MIIDKGIPWEGSDDGRVDQLLNCHTLREQKEKGISYWHFIIKKEQEHLFPFFVILRNLSNFFVDLGSTLGPPAEPYHL